MQQTNSKPNARRPSATGESAKKRSGEKRRWNPEKHPCFPRPDERKDEYNQEEEKTALPSGRVVL